MRSTVRLLAMLLAMVAARCVAQGGPPLLTDDPGTPGNRHWEINLGATTEIYEGIRDYELPLADFNYGWGEHIQLKYQFPLLVRDVNGTTQAELGDGVFGVKWRFLDEDKHGLNVSTYPQFSFNEPGPRRLVDRGAQMLLPVEVSKTLGKFELNWEGGYNIRQYAGDELLFGFAAAHEATPKLELLAEVHSVPDRTFSENEFVFEIGGRRKFSPHYVLLCAFGRGLPGSTGNQPSFLGFAGIQLLLGGKKD